MRLLEPRLQRRATLLLTAIVVLAATMARDANAQSAAVAKGTVIAVAGAPIPVRVLVTSPAETDTELQIICLFRSEPANALHGALTETNEKLHGLFDQIRKESLFRAELGETVVISAPEGTLKAKRVLLVGLGDSQTFAPERMELVGSIVYREANRLGVRHPFFAPTVIDGGITKYTTGEVAEQMIRGFLRAARTEAVLKDAGASAGTSIEDLTYLAGPTHAVDTREGIEKGIAGK